MEALNPECGTVTNKQFKNGLWQHLRATYPGNKDLRIERAKATTNQIDSRIYKRGQLSFALFYRLSYRISSVNINTDICAKQVVNLKGKLLDQFKRKKEKRW